MAMRPKVLLLDEPFAAVDVHTRSEMQDFLLDVLRGPGGASPFYRPNPMTQAALCLDGAAK